MADMSYTYIRYCSCLMVMDTFQKKTAVVISDESNVTLAFMK
jgi:hypothetical protein